MPVPSITQIKHVWRLPVKLQANVIFHCHVSCGCDWCGRIRSNLVVISKGYLGGQTTYPFCFLFSNNKLDFYSQKKTRFLNSSELLNINVRYVGYRTTQCRKAPFWWTKDIINVAGSQGMEAAQDCSSWDSMGETYVKLWSSKGCWLWNSQVNLVLLRSRKFYNEKKQRSLFFFIKLELYRSNP